MGKKVLIVDDSHAIRQQVRFALNKGGFEVVEADDGHTGIETLRAHPDIAMLISDIHMPHMDGLAMVEAIKADEAISHPPFMMLTTEGSIDMMARAKRAGAKGWMVKPFKADDLIAVVAKLAI